MNDQGRGGSGKRRSRLGAHGPTIEQARIFCLVASLGSYAKVAEQLGIAKEQRGPLARMVRRLGEALPGGVPLTSVSPDGSVELTSAGDAALPFAEALVRAADRLGEVQPRVRLTMYPAVALRVAQGGSGLLESTEVDLAEISDRPRSDGGRALVRDIAIGRADLAVAPEFLQTPAGVASVPAYSWLLRVSLSSRHPLAGEPTINPARIVKEGMRVVCSPPGHRSRALIEQAFIADRVPLPLAFASSDPFFIEQVARTGDSLAGVLPDDSFGAPKSQIGPVLVSEQDGPVGGSYAVYYRCPASRPKDATVAVADSDSTTRVLGVLLRQLQ
jgi:DNA-binding transcriptional LysR family regulator